MFSMCYAVALLPEGRLSLPLGEVYRFSGTVGDGDYLNLYITVSYFYNLPLYNP